MADQLLRFIFDQTDIRGEWVQLDRAYRDTLATHHHAPPVQRLLGEFVAASALLAATLKFDGIVTLQARSEGEVPFIMAEATSNHQLRAIARGAEEAMSDDFTLQLAQGQLAITIDPNQGARYQGIVPMEADSLAGCLEHYFRQSEQLPTRIWLAADGGRAAGLFLQELPSKADASERQLQWDHLLALAGTVTDAELLQLPGEQLLHRLFHQEPLRLLKSDALSFGCSCSRGRTEAMLAALGAAELQAIVAEQGEINVTCEFCNQTYRFDAADVGSLFGTHRSTH